MYRSICQINSGIQGWSLILFRCKGPNYNLVNRKCSLDNPWPCDRCPLFAGCITISMTQTKQIFYVMMWTWVKEWLSTFALPKINTNNKWNPVTMSVENSPCTSIPIITYLIYIIFWGDLNIYIGIYIMIYRRNLNQQVDQKGLGSPAD